MLTRRILNTFAPGLPSRSDYGRADDVAALRKQLEKLEKDHSDFVLAVKGWVDGLNLPGVLDITQAKIQQSTINSTTIGATTPAIGAFTTLTCTTINGLTITASTGTFTLANLKTLTVSNTLTLAGVDGKTLTVNKSLTLDGTDATVMTFPTTSATIARTDAAQTFTGVQTFAGNVTVSGSTVPANGMYLPAANTIGWATNSVLNMRLDASGNLGVGGAAGSFGKIEAIGAGYTAIASRSSDASGATAVLAANSSSEVRVGAVSNHDLAWYVNNLEKLRLTTDGRLYGPALHNNAGAVTGTTNQYIASGTYTPTLTNIANVAASTMRSCHWIRVGNVVTVAGGIEIDPTAAASTNFRITLPIASNFANTWECGGGGGFAGPPDAVVILAHIANDQAQFVFTATTIANATLNFMFSYVIL